MGRRIIVIASGDTERRALPHLLRFLKSEGIELLEVRIPPGHRQLSVALAKQLAAAAWYERIDDPPDKFVVLLDTDRNDLDEVLRPFRSELPSQLGCAGINAAVQVACACQHLEAWYFADQQGLRKYLNRALGNVDASAPDALDNPKLHLRHLLGERAYTAVVSEQIASILNTHAIAQRSPSFQAFIRACRNGTAT